MNWIKYSINTTTEAEDFVSAMLMDVGIVSIEIENNVPVSGEKQGGEFEELQPDLPTDDGTSKVCFYLGEDEDHESILSQVKAELAELKELLAGIDLDSFDE